MPFKRHPVKTISKPSVHPTVQIMERDAPPPKKVFTGNLLVRHDPAATLTAIRQKAKTRSLRLIRWQDLPAGNTKELLTGSARGSMTGPAKGSPTGLEQADGIIFERLKIALVSPDGAARLKQLQGLRNTPFLSSEPERYLYPAPADTKQNGPPSRSGLPFKDTAAATWGIQAINVRKSKFTGKGVKLAVLDTGFDFTHPDFMGRVIHRKSFVGARAKDREGHGTHCAGIAGGGRKGKAGIRYGVAPGSRLYIGKILDDRGEGSDGLALAGIEWALEQGCRVISMSFGAQVEKDDKHSEIFEEVAKTVMANNCLLIAATGNESRREKGRIAAVNHPANCPSIMAVGALTEFLKVADYSCGGRKGGQVDIAAPGDDILSAWIDGGHELESGTSMATPFVAGVAALLWEQYPDATAREIWDRLISQAQPLGLRSSGAGAGLVYVPS